MTMNKYDRSTLDGIKRDVEARGENAVIAKYRCGVYSAPHDVEIMVLWVRQVARELREASMSKVRVYSRTGRMLEL